MKIVFCFLTLAVALTFAGCGRVALFKHPVVAEAERLRLEFLQGTISDEDLKKVGWTRENYSNFEFRGDFPSEVKINEPSEAAKLNGWGLSGKVFGFRKGSGPEKFYVGNGYVVCRSHDDNGKMGEWRSLDCFIDFEVKDGLAKYDLNLIIWGSGISEKGVYP